jgi:hypothetical protein
MSQPYHSLTSHCNNFLDSRSDPDNRDDDDEDDPSRQLEVIGKMK